MQLSKKQLSLLVQQQYQSNELEDIYNKFSFWAPLKTSVVLSRGSGAASFTRATTATVEDWEGAIRVCKSGEVRFPGARRVENLLTFTEDFSNAAWSVSGSGTGSVAVKSPNYPDVPAPNGTYTACRVQAALNGGTTASDISVLTNIGIGVTGPRQCPSVWIRTTSGNTQNVLLRGNGTIASVSVTGQWQRFVSLLSSASSAIQIGARGGAVGTPCSDVVDVLVWRPQVEEVASTSPNPAIPSEYVSVGVLSSPFHGAMVDGVKYFDTENGNTVASNVVTEATGVPIDQTNVGYLPEGASTNLVLQSSNFGTTWTVAGTPTRTAAAAYCGDIALDLIGDDNAAAAEYYVQTLAFTGDASKSLSFLIKQGSAATTTVFLYDNTAAAFRLRCNLTWVGGAPTTSFLAGSQERAPEALGNGVWRIFFLASDVVAGNTNRLYFYPAGDVSTNTGDTYIGGVQAENALFASSHIPTTTATVTRNADILSYSAAGNADSASFSEYVELVQPFFTGSGQAVVSVNDGTGDERAYILSTNGAVTLYVTDGGVVQAAPTCGTAGVNTPSKVAARFSANDFAGVLNHGTVGTDVAGTMPTVTTINVGHHVSGVFAWFPLKNLRIAKVALSNAELVAITR